MYAPRLFALPLALSACLPCTGGLLEGTGQDRCPCPACAHRHGRRRAHHRLGQQRRVADLRPHLLRAAFQSADEDQPRQRQAAGPGLVLRIRCQCRSRHGSHAPDRRRRDLHLHQLVARVCAGCEDRPAQVELRPQGRRPERQGRLLRRGQSRRRIVERQGLRRRARRPAHRARRGHRQGSLVHADHRPRMALHHHRRTARGQGQGADRQWRRRTGRARLRLCLRCGNRRTGVALLHHAKSRRQTRRCGLGQDLRREGQRHLVR